MATAISILHICNGFNSDGFYGHLLEHLAPRVKEQTVFAPGRQGESDSPEAETVNISVHAPMIIRSLFDRIFFRRKIRKILSYIHKEKMTKGQNLVHAHTLFSDGAVALELFKRYGLPYIVAVRNVDVNLFLPYFPHLRKLGLAILKNAAKVIFISNCYLEHLEKYYPEWNSTSLAQKKTQTIFNGIDKYWLQNINIKNYKFDSSYRLLFVGDFKKNKNLHSTIAAIEILRKQGLDVSFEAIGYGSNRDNVYYAKKIFNTNKNNSQVSFLPRQSKEILLKKFAEADIFVVPSFNETFGLVYAEALSQGVPVIYTAKQGFDGIFPEGLVGASVCARNIYDIANGIENVIRNYNKITSQIASLDLPTIFSWSNIASQYLDVYQEVLTLSKQDRRSFDLTKKIA